MVSIQIDLGNKSEFSVVFYHHKEIFIKPSTQLKSAVLKAIDCCVQAKNKWYYIQITGLSMNMDDIAKELISRRYAIKNPTGKFIVKELAEMSILTQHREDFCLVQEYIDSFNEGEMTFCILDSPAKTAGDTMDAPVEEGKKVSVAINSDSDNFEVTIHDKQCRVSEFVCRICEATMAEPDGL